ncbi:hypothetical protein Syun_029736 [Stephania yunnanensis]|uniref:Uncharacterized protein n=1 Tax=Stephania yunnanensis TaxID=152371 RepID=A0AAP0HJT4_9MAGN
MEWRLNYQLNELLTSRTYAAAEWLSSMIYNLSAATSIDQAATSSFLLCMRNLFEKARDLFLRFSWQSSLDEP